MRRIMTVRILVILSLCTSLLGGCGTVPATSTPKEMTDVTIAMGFIPNVQFAPFYVAMEKGYFEEEGLNVSFNYGFDTDLIKLLAADEHQFVVGSGDQVILARAQGLPIVYVLNWFQQFPVSIVSLKETGISEPADLIGKVVGTPVMFGASYIGWKALAMSAGIPEEQVTLQAIGYTQVASLLEGRVDAAVCYTANEPVQLRVTGHEVHEILVSDYVNMVSNGLLTNEKTIRERPDTAQALVRATLRGIRDTVNNPEEAFELCLRHVPEAGGENAVMQKAVLMRSVEIWKADKYGVSHLDAWKLSVDFMMDAGLVDERPDVDSLFTNRFVDNARIE